MGSMNDMNAVPPAGSDVKVPILIGAVVALLGANIYLFTQLNAVRSDLVDFQKTTQTEISSLKESSTVSTQTARRSLTSLKDELEAARRQAQMSAGQREILHLREVAKKNKDVIKLNCINDKLVELKAQQNVADGYAHELTTALDSNSDERFAAYASFDSTITQINVLTEQARACIGEPELYKQESGVEVEKPEIPDDPTVNPFGTELDVEPPAYASPFD